MGPRVKPEDDVGNSGDGVPGTMTWPPEYV